MYQHVFKRVIDILVGLVAIPFVALTFVIFAPIIYFTDHGPIFYNAQRLGLHGKPFVMFKYRSMYVDAPDIRNADGSTYNGEDDPRVTPVGRFMRKTSIDEFPQFVNVLFGQMSFIGPRPDPLSDMDVYTEEQKRKLDVLPGITGYSQAYFRNSVLQDEKFQHDVFYAENISFLLDVKILFKTVQSVLFRKNVFNDASAPDEEGQKILESISEERLTGIK